MKINRTICESMLPELDQLWEAPPANWPLSSNDVHVWSAKIDPADARAEQLELVLSADELRRSKQFRCAEDQRRFVIGRGVLREILGMYARVEPREIIFRYGAFGKPELAHPAKTGLQFNLSHSGELALFAVSLDRELGIDLERICFLPETDAIAQGFFSEKQKAMLRAAPADRRQTSFYQSWTRTEAVLKCTGRGFLDDVEARSLPENFDGKICELIPANGYAASLAVRGRPFELSAWRWPQGRCWIP